LAQAFFDPDSDQRPALPVAGDVLVRFTGVEKTYDGMTLVVRNLDLDVRSGEFLTLLGPSGSGKTTTLMMLAGFEVPTRGMIFFGGRDITNVPPYKRGIGMVFQNYALFPHMSVAENLAFPLSVRGFGRAEQAERVSRALEMVQLHDLGSRMPAQLSGGQQQRVALARALIFEPTLVLMDEPLGALDRQLREHMQYEIKTLHSRLGLTFIYVTHDQGEALTMSDRIAVFNRGRIQQVATPREIYDRPLTAFVAQFIGENNRIEARIKKLTGTRAVAVTPQKNEMSCEAAPGLSVGDPVLISVRPESVYLTSGARSDNTLSARITNIIYHGDHIRLHLLTEGDIAFILKSPVKDIGDAKIGMPIEIGWRAEDARALAVS
jgi:putative spermidine/putrescine transport system ATP-binding protein